MNTTRGTLFIVAAPSGAGKSSLVNAVLAKEPGIALSISFTSRAPRPGERHAQHYHFVSKEEFVAMVAAGDFFEHAQVHGDYKGTARQSVEPQLAAGKDVLLEIDWQGARQVREQVPDCVSVFILPPSRDALQTRMRNRGQDSEETIARRLAKGGDPALDNSENDDKPTVLALREIAARKVDQAMIDDVERAERERAEREALEWAAAEVVDDDLGKGGDDL